MEETFTHYDGTIDTYSGGVRVRREWSDKRTKAFNQKAQPGSKIAERAKQAMINKYGWVSTSIPERIPAWAYYVIGKDGRQLKIKTCVYGQTLDVGFVSLETAQSWAKKVNGECRSTVYGISHMLNGETLNEYDCNWQEIAK